jgi:preprotein translocase subunit SecG
MTFIYYSAIFLFLIISTILCLVILVQESKSMGLGASFGGDAGESLFGTSTASVLKKFTAYLGVVFIVACILLSIWSESMGKPKSIQLPSIEQTQNLP